MKSLFPEMEREISEDRKAERRERRQRALEYLRKRDLSWIINSLLDGGPKTEVALIMSVMDEDYHHGEFVNRVAEILLDLAALNAVGKLWKKDMGIHHGSGERSYLYGIRKVHPAPAVEREKGSK